MSNRLWRVAVTVADEASAGAVAGALGALVPALGFFETAPGAAWRVEGFAAEAPDRAALAALAAFAGAEDVEIEALADRDWLAENRESFPPLRAGRFFVHGSHVRQRPPAGTLGLRIDATTAFGTGEHATTRGCLLAIEGLYRRRRFRRVLDMGTGTGILAMAAARRGAGRVLALDLDAGAVRVAAANMRANGVAARVAVGRSDGYRSRRIARARPYDLVLANILARPLARMAPYLAAVLAPGGAAVLSGLLARQEALVLAAHRDHGLVLHRRIAVDGWHTLVLGR